VAYLSGHSHRNEIHDDAPIQCVASATTSKNFDHAPMGFTLWRIGPERPLKHEYVPVEGAKPPEEK
jgi:hypothetical protein